MNGVKATNDLTLQIYNCLGIQVSLAEPGKTGTKRGLGRGPDEFKELNEGKGHPKDLSDTSKTYIQPLTLVRFHFVDTELVL